MHHINLKTVVLKVFAICLAVMASLHVSAADFKQQYANAKKPKLVLNWSNLPVMLGEESMNEFRRGVNQGLVNAGVRLIDRATAINFQLIDDDRVGIYHADAISRHEAEALNTYADVLGVIRTDHWSKDDKRVVVTLIDLSTRLIQYQGVVEVDVPYVDKDEPKEWVGTDKGYQKQVKDNCPWQANSSGYQRRCEDKPTKKKSIEYLGLNTAEQLINVWGEVL